MKPNGDLSKAQTGDQQGMSKAQTGDQQGLNNLRRQRNFKQSAHMSVMTEGSGAHLICHENNSKSISSQDTKLQGAKRCLMGFHMVCIVVVSIPHIANYIWNIAGDVIGVIQRGHTVGCEPRVHLHCIQERPPKHQGRAEDGLLPFRVRHLHEQLPRWCGRRGVPLESADHHHLVTGCSEHGHNRGIQRHLPRA